MALTPDQIANRVNFIGSSDAPAILGLSRYKTPIQVWAEKCKLVVPEDISMKLPIRLGNRLERTVLALFMQETGLKVRRSPETIYHPNFSFLGATLDGVVGNDELVEAKTASAFKRKEWESGEAPPEYLVQVLHQLGISGRKKGYLVVLIGNDAFKVVEILRDETLISEIIHKEVDFWTNYVVPKVMPQLVTKNDAEILSLLYPKDNNESVPLNDEANRIIDSIKMLENDKKQLEDLITKNKNELKMMLKDCTYGISEQWKVSWKLQKKKAYSVPESETRILTIRENKE